ncbi:hypothetical protein BDW62DRAFT_211614 [Aspergillus aurantiobrunneus]
MTSRPGLVLVGRLQHCEPEWKALESKQQFLEDCQSDAFNRFVGLYGTNSIAEAGNLDQSLACAQCGIRISNTPVVANTTVAVAMLLISGSLRHAMISLEAVLGIVGMGGIGQALARRARAFGMKIMYHNRSRLSEKGEAIQYYQLEPALTATKHHLISKPEIQQTKDGAITSNTARGPLLDEEALIMLLPHLGPTTVETQREMELLAIRNLESALDRGELLSPIS